MKTALFFSLFFLLFATDNARIVTPGDDESLPTATTTPQLLFEEERIKLYHERNYTWPLPHYVPNTTGWKTVMDARFAQLAELEDDNDRFQGYFQTMHSAFTTPNYTAHGFALTRCPDELLAALQQGIRDGLSSGAATEEELAVTIPGPQRPLLVTREDLTERVLTELQPFAETWANLPLTAHGAYGFRLYRNESQLYMHVDRMETHIISFILHIDSSDDAQPWPIFIEDFHGRTHEVVLSPGDVLFYESAKCLHGRPRPFNGSWYTSVFAHYYPRDNWATINHERENRIAIPPHYANKPKRGKKRKHPKLEMMGTSMREPDCPDDWCRTLDTIKSTGPAQAGSLTLPTSETIPFDPKSYSDVISEEL